MKKLFIELRDEYGGYLRVEDAGEEVRIELKSTTDAENYFTESMTLTRSEVESLIEALQRSIAS